MHELSLAQSLLDTALHHPACTEDRRIARLRVRVGALAGVDTDALSFCFELSSKNTRAEGAELQVEVAPARGRCRKCGAERILESLDRMHGGTYGWKAFDPDALDLCSCGERSFDLVGGYEIMLIEMELEETRNG